MKDWRKKSIIDLLIDTAVIFERAAQELRSSAESFNKTDNLDYISEAANVVRNSIGNVRLDLFVTRAVRALTSKDQHED